MYLIVLMFGEIHTSQHCNNFSYGKKQYTYICLEIDKETFACVCTHCRNQHDKFTYMHVSVPIFILYLDVIPAGNALSKKRWFPVTTYVSAMPIVRRPSI